MSNFAEAAAQVRRTMAARPKTPFARTAAEVRGELKKSRTGAAADRDAEWQRVNSYIADVLKDSHVLYAKLARLQGDFAGEELARLEKISEAVLMIGDELSRFSKAFYDGKYAMLDTEFAYGNEGAAGGGAPAPQEAAPAKEAPSPAPEVPVKVEGEGEEGEEGGGEAGAEEAQEKA